MIQNVKNILKTGDICELKDFNEETFAICIEGKIYIDLPNNTIYEVSDFEENVIRVLRPLKIENALEMWRYANEGTWRAFVSPPLGTNSFKTIYVKNEPIALRLEVLRTDLNYSDERVIHSVKHAMELNPTCNLKLLWELLSAAIQPLLNRKEYEIAYLKDQINIIRLKGCSPIAKVFEMLEEG